MSDNHHEHANEGHAADHDVSSQSAKEQLIKINLPVFEEYLHGIKAQLQRHEHQLENPIWADYLKHESDKIMALTRRLEHTQLDVNAVKDFIYHKDSGGKEKQRKDPMLLLQADVESLKLVARRIDLYQSEDLNVYLQLKKLQKDYNELLKMIEKLDKDSVINEMKLDFNSKIGDVRERLDNTNEVLEESRAVLDEKIDTVYSTIDSEIRLKIKDVQDQINAFLSDGEGDEEVEEGFGEEEMEEGEGDRDPQETDVFPEESPTLGGSEILKPSEMARRPTSATSASSLLEDSASGENSPGKTRGSPEMTSFGAMGRGTIRAASPAEARQQGSPAAPSPTPSLPFPQFKRQQHSDSTYSISNAQPGPASGSPFRSPAGRSTFAAGTALSSTVKSLNRGTLNGGDATPAGASPARRQTMKGGKFCTLERFLQLHQEVELLKHLLQSSILKLRSHGVSRLQGAFARYLARDAHFLMRGAFDKLSEHMHLKSRDVRCRYATMTAKVDYVVERANGRQKVRAYFQRWTGVTRRLREGQRLYHYSRGIVGYWLGRVKPDVRRYLNIWKNFTVESFRQCVYVGLDDSEAPAFDEFQALLNGNFNMKAMKRIAHKDLLRRMKQREAKAAANAPVFARDEEAEARLQETIGGLTKRLEESEEEGRVLRRDVLRLFAIFEGNKADITGRIDTETTRILGSINNFKSKVTTQLTHASDLIELNQKRNDTTFALHADISEGLRAKLNGVERELDFHQQTQTSIISSQKSIRVEMDELLVKQEYIDSRFKQVNNEIMMNAKAMHTGIEEVRRVEAEYRDITSFYDSELREVKAQSAALEASLAESVRVSEAKTDRLELKTDLLAANQDEVFPQKPQVQFVYEICRAYEAAMLRVHSEGGVSALNPSIERELQKIAADMSVEATRIAHLVVTTADRLVSHRLMDSLVLQSATPANFEREQHAPNYDVTLAMTFASLGANHGVHNNHNHNVKALPVSVQVTQQREAVLNDFMNQFVALLRERDPNPGVLKASARVAFHAKLRLTTEVLISKSNCMFNLLDNPSALTRKPYGESSSPAVPESASADTCVACSRPMAATHGTVRPPSAVPTRPSSAAKPAPPVVLVDTSAAEETAANVRQLQEQLARVTAAMTRLRLLDREDLSKPFVAVRNSTGILRPRGTAYSSFATVESAETPFSGLETLASPSKFKRAGTAHTISSVGTSDNQRESPPTPQMMMMQQQQSEAHDRHLVDSEHLSLMNTRRNSNSNVNFTMREGDFAPPQHSSTPPRVVVRSRSPSPGLPVIADEYDMPAPEMAQEPPPEFDVEGFHQFLSSTAAEQQQQQHPSTRRQQPSSAGAVRHREALRKSHAMLLTTQGGGFKTSPPLSQEEMVLALTASFRADVTHPRDIGTDRSDLLRTEEENLRREAALHALNDEEGLLSALSRNYSTSAAAQSLPQTESHLLGSRRLVGNGSAAATASNRMLKSNSASLF